MTVKLFENITNPSTIVPKKEVIQVKKFNYLNFFQFFGKNNRKKKPRKQTIRQKQKLTFHQL